MFVDQSPFFTTSTEHLPPIMRPDVLIFILNSNIQSKYFIHQDEGV